MSSAIPEYHDDHARSCCRPTGDSITSTLTGKTYTVLDVGILSPREISIADLPDPDSRVLRKGMVGYITCGMKDPKDGETDLLSLLSISANISAPQPSSATPSISPRILHRHSSRSSLSSRWSSPASIH